MSEQPPVGPAHLAPRLVHGVQRRARPAGGTLLARPGAVFLDVAAAEVGVLDLLDGSLSLEALVARALTLQPPVRPLALLRLLRRLHSSGFVDGLEGAARDLFGRRPRGRLRRWLWPLLDLRLHVTPLRVLAAWGALVPRGAWTVFHALSAVAFLSFLVLAAVLDVRLDPLPGPGDGLPELLGSYVAVAFTLSVRSLLRGAALRSQGVGVPAGGLRLLAGVLHVDVDCGERGAAPRAARLQVALVGLSAVALVAAVAGWLHLLLGTPIAARVAASASLLLVLVATPYARTDLWHLQGLLTRIPGLRRRTLAFLLGGLGRVLGRRGDGSAGERPYVLLSSLWLGHTALALYLLGEHLLPSALALLMDSVTGQLPGDAAQTALLVASAALCVGLLVTLGTLALALVVVVAASVRALFTGLRRRRPQAVLPREEERQRHRALLDTVPVLAVLEPSGRDLIVEHMRVERYRPGREILTQGRPRDRLCLLVSGTCGVELQEPSGLRHAIGRLDAGDCFGELALVDDGPRGATVRADSECVVLALDRRELDELAAELGPGLEALRAEARLRAELSRLPGFLHLAPGEVERLRKATHEVSVAGGATVVGEGERDDALYLIRSGSCRVRRAGAGGAAEELATLSSGDHFGAVAPLLGVARTASVVADVAVTLLRVDGDALRQVLLENFLAALRLQQGFTQVYRGGEVR